MRIPSTEIDHGPDGQRQAGDAAVFDYVAGAGVPGAVEPYARRKVARLFRLAPRPVVYARVTVSRLPGRKGRRSAAEAVLDVGGRLVRAHVEASDALEAVDLLQERLRARLVRLADRRRSGRRRPPPAAHPGVLKVEPDSGDGADEEPSPVRARLVEELERLLSVRATLLSEGLDAMTETEDVAELSGVDQHPADLGTETFERERDLSLLHEVEAEVDDARRAFVRMSRGTYGRCEGCGAPIPDERLMAVPATRLCLADQERAEDAAGRRRALGVPLVPLVVRHAAR